MLLQIYRLYAVAVEHGLKDKHETNTGTGKRDDRGMTNYALYGIDIA